MEYLGIDSFLELCATEMRGALPGPYPVANVRSPSEFAQGHIPGAVNIPLFSDVERAEVGRLHKQESPEAAVIRGLEIAGPKLGDLARAAYALWYAPHQVDKVKKPL